MNYCNGCDIAFENKNCPLCEAKKNITALNKEIDDLLRNEIKCPYLFNAIRRINPN